ncbi:hypothetical protein [Gluconobacter wancherniae]|uniref:hypothetical protein n=1 Tax=Gluconobacter wancherniae TaxID=1307955 RepID=UPI001B8BAE97|nr:hypothetical protein [Gluconobacter wancherniae]MBS1089777.1 hypothetical protein [Gluconobacter wancherniae]
MATVPGQAVAPFEQPHLDGRFVATGAHAFIATGSTAARFIRRSAATRAGNRQCWIALFPVRVATAAGCGLLGICPAHWRPATRSWDIGELVALHDARSISGSSNIIAAVRQTTVLQQCRAAAGSASPAPTRRRRSRRAWGGQTATHLLQHGRLTGSGPLFRSSFFYSAISHLFS